MLSSLSSICCSILIVCGIGAANAYAVTDIEHRDAFAPRNFNYDNAGDLTKAGCSSVGAGDRASTLTHDVAGNLIGVADSVDASYNRTLIHDGINRVTTINGPWGAGSVSYDGAGNISGYSLGSNIRSYTYSPQNLLQRVQLRAGTAPNFDYSQTVYSYDPYGNASPGGYSYDNASNLTSNGAASANAYDGTNTRVKTVAGGVTTYEFRSAHGLLLAEWRKQSGYYDLLKEHIHLAGKEVAEQQTQFIGTDIKPVSWIFLQNDANGSPVASTWAGGGLLFKENYQPYGSQINATAQGYTQRAFAGHRQDKTDLIYMGARYYNPQIGRFLSIDPKEADPSDLHGLNRYAYANNNPYRYVDPDGRAPATMAEYQRSAAAIQIYQHCSSSSCVSSALAGMVQVRDDMRAAGVDSYDRSAINATIGQAASFLGDMKPALEAAAQAGIVALTQGAGSDAKTAAVIRADNLAKGIPAQALGPSGKPKIHVVQHSSLKAAKDAARGEVGAGGSVEKHANPEVGNSHFHGVNQDGEKDRTHHEYP